MHLNKWLRSKIERKSLLVILSSVTLLVATSQTVSLADYLNTHKQDIAGTILKGKVLEPAVRLIME